MSSSVLLGSFTFACHGFWVTVEGTVTTTGVVFGLVRTFARTTTTLMTAPIDEITSAASDTQFMRPSATAAQAWHMRKP